MPNEQQTDAAQTEPEEMSYTPTVWRDGLDGGTPINAANLNNIEEAIVALVERTSQQAETSMIADGAVSADKIAAGAVTVPKLGDDVMTRTGSVLLWSGVAIMTAAHKFTFNSTDPNRKSNVANQPHGLVFVFSIYDTSKGTAHDYYWSSFFIPKHIIAQAPGQGHCLSSLSTDKPAMAKCIYISDTQFWGCGDNNKAVTNAGVSINNSNWVLRYVFGV